jgi:hypothetical protein
MTRRALLVAACAARLRGDSADEVWDLFTRAASALSDGNAAGFLTAFDSSMPGFAEFRANITALVRQAEVQSSIDFLEDTGDDRARTVELDWRLAITDRQRGVSSIRRRERVKCRVEKSGKRWRIVALQPQSLFTPLTADR